MKVQQTNMSHNTLCCHMVCHRNPFVVPKPYMSNILFSPYFFPPAEIQSFSMPSGKYDLLPWINTRDHLRPGLTPGLYATERTTYFAILSRASQLLFCHLNYENCTAKSREFSIQENYPGDCDQALPCLRLLSPALFMQSFNSSSSHFWSPWER